MPPTRAQLEAFLARPWDRLRALKDAFIAETRVIPVVHTASGLPVATTTKAKRAVAKRRPPNKKRR
jgi:hypothetical protein